MMFRILAVHFLAATVLLSAETRVWRNAEGTKSIEAVFVKRGESSVTIRRSDQSEVSIPLDKIHRDDRAWLEARHPLPSAEPPPAPYFVFDRLEFGDSRAEVMEKLKASDRVKLTLPETMLARTGLNGVFQTVENVGGQGASLYFDWCEEGGLKEITLKTPPVTGEETETRLHACWKDCIDLLTTRHGQPMQANGKLEISTLQDHSMSATHLWKLEDHGTAMLGAARDGGSYQIAVRFTTEDIKPIIVPGPNTVGQ
jgi:hypothetical protein